jgi:hypothetical protein
MKNVFKPLAELDFGKIISEAFADTNTGTQLLNKYRQYMLTNEASCTVVNNFLKDAKRCMYDSGISDLVSEISNFISECQVSWKLASVCEQINSNRSSYNYLNRNAAATVEKLLEQDEENVVKYIKAGALKQAMFCESIRNIVNSVFTDVQTIITEEYKATHPISYFEINEGKHYFEVLGKIYCVDGDQIKEAKSSEVSADFLMISRLLESTYANFDANTETLTVDTPLAQYDIHIEESCDKVTCKRTSKKKCADDNTCKVQEQVFDNVNSLREHNRLVASTCSYNTRRQTEELLESIARTFEHFDNFALLDNVQIVENAKEKFVVIENKTNMFAYSLKSTKSAGWKINTSIVEALDFIKKRTDINICKDYKDNVNEQIAKVDAERANDIKESIKRDEMNARKQKIEMLTEKFKNDPATLAVLSKVAESLNNEI